MKVPIQSWDDDNPLAESLAYLNEHQALVGTGEGRIFLLDIDLMQVVDEVAIEGHEPRPVGHYYPGLAKETGLATDISLFDRFGDAIIFVYRRDQGTGLADWNDSLLRLSVKG